MIVFDAVIDDDRRHNAFGLLMSLNMLIETPAGNDYTGADCQGWLRDVGFADTYVEHLVGPESMVVGIKGWKPSRTGGSCGRRAKAERPGPPVQGGD